MAVDVDNLDDLPMKLGCEIHIPLGGKEGPHIPLQFSELGDFHPDRIFDRLEVFQKLKATRKLMQNPATFAEAASQVRSWISADKETDRSEPEQAQSGTKQDESDTQTFERLLGKRPDQKSSSASSSRFVDIDALIRETVKPYIVPTPDPQQAELLAQVDQAISGQMRAILHQPHFRQLEATWRILHFLVSRIETDETLKIYIIDVSKAELAADLVSADALQSTGMHRLIVEQSVGVAGAEPYTVLVCGYTFDQTTEDIKLLQHLARIAQAAGSPLVTSADSHFAGCQSLAATPDPNDWQWQPDPAASQLWQQLQQSPEAAYIGLSLPRFLLRLPYGKDTDPIERFDFDEFSTLAGHEQYLWGNSAAICVCLLAEAFREFGWALSGGLGREMAGLPMHIYTSDGEKHFTGCAETMLTERAMEVLIDKGLMPVLSIKGRDAVLLPRFQSIAKPLSPLAGPWQ
jgi:type VI secretion system protein ImpC